MEKGIKVVAVNDPFIDPEYMVSGTWMGPARLALKPGRELQDLSGGRNLAGSSPRWGLVEGCSLCHLIPGPSSVCCRYTCSNMTPHMVDIKETWNIRMDN